VRPDLRRDRSGLTWLVGRPLIALNGERYAREAEFRFALVRVNESGESIALHGGEKDERRYLEAALASVVDTMRRISTSLAQLTWITSGTGWLSLVVPILVAAPAYFGGHLTLGGLIMVAGAFTQVQGAMRWFVDNFSRLADWVRRYTGSHASAKRSTRCRRSQKDPRRSNARRIRKGTSLSKESGFSFRTGKLSSRMQTSPSCRASVS